MLVENQDHLRKGYEAGNRVTWNRKSQAVTVLH